MRRSLNMDCILRFGGRPHIGRKERVAPEDPLPASGTPLVRVRIA